MNKTLKTLLTTGGIVMALVAVGCGDDDNAATGKDSGTTDSGQPSDSGTTDSGGGDAGDGSVPLATGPIDRMGRAAINTVLTAQADKDTYNKEPTYAAATVTNATIGAEFNAALTYLDGLDGTRDFGEPATPSAANPHPLAGPLLVDTLVVDTSQLCDSLTPSTYLDVEPFLLGIAPPNSTCGGRMPNDDSVDVSLSLLVGGPTAYGACKAGLTAATPDHTQCIGDGVDAPAAPATDVFPYLVAPQ